MANCCDDPVIPPACVHRCPQTVDACCVVDEQPLDCIFEPIVVTASGIITQFVITVDDVSGILVGMLATGQGIGIAAIVTKIEGLVVTLSVANIATFPGVSVSDQVTFHLIDNTQCDINLAINDILCQLKAGGIPCPVWNDVTLDDPIMSLVWVASSKTQYSDPLSCVVRLRGTLQTSMPLPIAQTAINSQLFLIPVGASRPAITKVLPTVVVVNSDDQFTALYVPALIIVTTSGTVQVSFTNFNPNVPRNSTCDDCVGGDAVATPEPYFTDATELIFAVTLDGLTFETQP